MPSVLLAIGLLASGCRAPTPVGTWEHVVLSTGGAPVVLAAMADRLIVGTAPAPGSGPGLVSLASDGGQAALPAVAASPYGAEAIWASIAVAAQGSDPALLAVGGQHGGAHSNVRWSVWSGSASSGLTEQPQTFETFGGWGAGDLRGAALTPTGPVLLGSWQAAGPGLEPTLWRPDGSTWQRTPSTGTALANTSSDLYQATAIASSGDLAVIVGSDIRLVDPPMSIGAIWVGNGAAWTAHAAGSATEGSRVEAVACQPAGCVAVGRSGGALAVFAIGAQEVEPLAVPRQAVAAEAPAPVIAVGASGDVVVALGSARGSTVLTRATGGGWTTADGPPGTPVAAAMTDAAAWLIVAGADGATTLWRRPR